MLELSDKNFKAVIINQTARNKGEYYWNEWKTGKFQWRNGDNKKEPNGNLRTGKYNNKLKNMTEWEK